MSNETKAVRKFGIVDKVGYMFGDFGNDFTFLLSSMFLMKFYTDVMGISSGLVGLMMMVARFIDGFTDILVGQLVDRSESNKKGKFAPWILKVAGPVSIASFLMYATWFQNMPMGFKIFWMFFTYLLWGSICYSGINIPYGSMASAISADPKDRAQLSSWRTIGATLANTVIGVALPLIVYYKDADGNSVISGSRTTFAALICSIGALVCYLLCYNLTTERVKVAPKGGKFSFKELINSLTHNRSLIGIVVCALFLLLAQLSLSNMANYIYPNYFGNTEALSVATLATTAVTLVLTLVVVKLAEKIGKREVGILGSFISAGAMIIAFILHTTNVWVWVVLYTIAMGGVAMFNIVVWAMITDVIDDTEIKTGERTDGTIYSIYSFARKCGQALSSGLAGLLLSIIGYSQATAHHQDVIDGIYNITCLAPAIAFILMALALIFLYPLNKKRVEENAAILIEKQKKLN